MKEIKSGTKKGIISIKKGQRIGECIVGTDEDEDVSYQLGLFENGKSVHPVPNSNQITVSPSEGNINNMKPNCIDSKLVIMMKDEIKGFMYIYWSIPKNSFGDISYKVINDDTKEEEEINVLPYQIALTSIPQSVSIITLLEIDNEIYESDAFMLFTQ